MQVYHSLAEVPADFGPSALTIGNFDGVHFGHRQILRRVKEIAAARGWKPSVLTFDPHPTRVVAPARTPPLLTSPDRRAALMSEEGIAQVLILPFTHEVAMLTPEEFVEQLLVKAPGRARRAGGRQLPFRTPPGRQRGSARRTGPPVRLRNRNRARRKLAQARGLQQRHPRIRFAPAMCRWPRDGCNTPTPWKAR